jgi:hypothetical protein
MRCFFLGLAILASLAVPPTVVMADEAADTMMAQKIAGHFKTSGRLQKYSLGVKCKDGTALLKGTVTDQQQLQTALDLARATPGVNRVINQMTAANGAAPQQARPAATIQQPRRMATATRTNLEEPSYSGPEFNMSSSSAAVPQQSVVAEPQHPARAGVPLAIARRHGPMRRGAPGPAGPMMGGAMGAPGPMASGVAQARFDQPNMPNYAWPSYAAHPNYAAVTYPKQYSPTAWPYIGPFYPYPQVPLGWRKVTLEWDDGWWQLDFKSN